MDQETRKKLERIRVLMERAATEGEAQAAAAALQRMILRHNLTEAELITLGEKPSEKYDSVYFRVGESKTPGLQWKLNLIYTLAEFNFCVFIREGHHGGTGWIVGQPSNIEATQIIFQTTMEAAERIALSAFGENGHAGGRLKWTNSFKIGFVYGIHQKMRAERQAQALEAPQINALVVVKDEELNEAVAEKIGKTTTHQGSSATDASAFGKGVEKGRTHSLQDRIST